MSSTKQTIVEDGTELKGTLSSSCPVIVRGRVEGEVNTPSLLVSEHGALHGRATVGSLRSEGELSGEFDADTVELAGRVKDRTVIRARSLEVKLSSEDSRLQITFGDCELAVGDAPSDDPSLARRAKSSPAKDKKEKKSEPAAGGENSNGGGEPVL